MKNRIAIGTLLLASSWMLLPGENGGIAAAQAIGGKATTPTSAALDPSPSQFVTNLALFNESLWEQTLFVTPWSAALSSYDLNTVVSGEGSYQGTNNYGEPFALHLDFVHAYTPQYVLSSPDLTPTEIHAWTLLNLTFCEVSGQISTAKGSQLVFGWTIAYQHPDGTSLNYFHPLMDGFDFGSFSGPPSGVFTVAAGGFAIPPAPDCGALVPRDFCGGAPVAACSGCSDGDLYDCKRVKPGCIDEACEQYDKAKKAAYDQYKKSMDEGEETAKKTAEENCKGLKVVQPVITGGKWGASFGGVIGGIAGGLAGGVVSLEKYLDCMDSQVAAVMKPIHEAAVKTFDEAIEQAVEDFKSALAGCCVTCPKQETEEEEEKDSPLQIIEKDQ